MIETNALIISAGFSRRMKAFKPLLRWDKVPFIITIIVKASTIANHIRIVTGFRSKDIQEEIRIWLSSSNPVKWQVNSDLYAQLVNLKDDRFTTVFNPDYKKGMFESIRYGLIHIPQSDWILLHFVDQPQLPIQFYSDFKKEINSDYDWIQPVYQNQKGHPVLFNSTVRQKILTARQDMNLKVISDTKSIQKKYWRCPYSQVLQDFNTPENFITGGEKNENS